MKNYKKYVIGALVVAMSVGVLASAGNAHAQYTTTVTFATSQNTPPQFTLIGSSPLSLGMRGANVVQLQGVLSELGYLNVPIGIPFGYFGSMTKSALIRYQSDLGVPATGYFGSLTMAAMQTSFNSHGWLALLYPNATGLQH